MTFDLSDAIADLSEEKIMLAFKRALRAADYTYVEDLDGYLTVFDDLDQVDGSTIEADPRFTFHFTEQLKIVAVTEITQDLLDDGILKISGIAENGEIIYELDDPAND
jgi:hypothetical protein